MRDMFKVILLSTLIVAFNCSVSLIVTSSAPYFVALHSHQPITNFEEAKLFIMKQSPQLIKIVHDGLTLPELKQQLISITEQFNYDLNSISSFWMNHDLKLRNYTFKETPLPELKSAMQSEKNNVIVIGDLKDQRLLHNVQVQEGKSLMFLSMTPQILSGLFVGLFLIVMMIIALNCLYNIKTHQAFAKTHLWVGKES